MPALATAQILPSGNRYVRYGTMARGKFHIMRDRKFHTMRDYEGLCGVSPCGLSPCTATSDVLASAGWLDAGHICKRCIAALD